MEDKAKKDTQNKSVKTSWGSVATWYDKLLENGEDTYQDKVILPNLSRIIDLHNSKDKTILDLACGQGFWSRLYAKAGFKVIASDISSELISIAKSKTKEENLKIDFHVSSADDISFLKDDSVDFISIILAIQNIENINGVMSEAQRVLKKGGKMIIVLNHPAFRIPKKSFWDFDNSNNIQYRRLDEYMSESREKIDMTPGIKYEKEKKYTVSFHRPLQIYFKTLSKNNFAVSRLEEWISHKSSQEGPKSMAEDKARKEFPMFMCLEAIKL